MGEENLVYSVNRTASYLPISRPTIRDWIEQGLLVPFESEKIEKRINHWFENAYIEEIAKILPPKKPGGHVLDDDLKAAIESINLKFRKKRRPK